MQNVRIKFYTRAWPQLKNLNVGFLKELKDRYNVLQVEAYPDIIFFENQSVVDECCLLKIFITGEYTMPKNPFEYDLVLGVCETATNHYYLPLWTFSVDWDVDATHEYSVTKLLSPRSDTTSRDHFCGFVACHSRPLRDGFVATLSRSYKKVTCAGKIMNNFSQIGFESKDKCAFLKTCRFAIAFENETGTDDERNGYTTEKILDAFVAGAIPIYWGNVSVESIFNGAAFLNRHNFLNDEEFVKAIIEIDQDKKKYDLMRNQPIFKNNTIPESFYPLKVCEKIYALYKQKRKLTITYGAYSFVRDVTNEAMRAFLKNSTTLVVEPRHNFNELFGDHLPNIKKRLIFSVDNGTMKIELEEFRTKLFSLHIGDI